MTFETARAVLVAHHRYSPCWEVKLEANWVGAFDWSGEHIFAGNNIFSRAMSSLCAGFLFPRLPWHAKWLILSKWHTCSCNHVGTHWWACDKGKQNARGKLSRQILQVSFFLLPRGEGHKLVPTLLVTCLLGGSASALLVCCACWMGWVQRVWV